jgi:hypothetical protein
MLKGSLTREFQLQVFFTPMPLRNLLEPLQIFTKIREDIPYLMFITGVASLVEKRQLSKCLNLGR